LIVELFPEQIEDDEQRAFGDLLFFLDSGSHCRFRIVNPREKPFNAPGARAWSRGI